MVRSLGFGSIIFDQNSPFLDLFSLRLQKVSLTWPKTMSRRLILQQASGQQSLPQIDCFKFHNLFHSPMGVLFHLSLTVLFAISDSRVFSLTRWSSLIHKGFLVSQATREIGCLKRKKNWTFTIYGAGFSCLKFSFRVESLRDDNCRASGRIASRCQAQTHFFPTTLLFISV